MRTCRDDSWSSPGRRHITSPGRRPTTRNSFSYSKGCRHMDSKPLESTQSQGTRTSCPSERPPNRSDAEVGEVRPEFLTEEEMRRRRDVATGARRSKFLVWAAENGIGGECIGSPDFEWGTLDQLRAAAP